MRVGAAHNTQSPGDLVGTKPGFTNADSCTRPRQQFWCCSAWCWNASLGPGSKSVAWLPRRRTGLDVKLTLRVVRENVGMARGSGPTASSAKAQTLPGAGIHAGVGETSRRADCDQSNPPPGEAQTAIVEAHRSWIARRPSDGVTPLQKRVDERRVRRVGQGVLDLADRHVGHCEQLARLRIAHLIENGLEAGPLDWRSPSDARRRRGWWEPRKE
jgi:hypothetical protein